MNWRLVAIPLSILPFLIMFFFTPVSPSDVFAVGIFPFVLSAAAFMGKVLLQALRFRYFIKQFIGRDVSSFGKTISARFGGEFVTQTTPSYVGGELVRIAWLTRNGVPAGKAAWVTTMEIIADVFVGSMLAIIAGIIAINNGGSFIGITVIIVTIPTFVFWFLLLVFSAKRNLRLPHFSQRLAQRFISKEKAERAINSANSAIADLCQMSRENFRSKAALKSFIVGIAITFVAFIFQGISFLVLADSVNSGIGLFESLLATSASTALANLPITIGGSGLAELGVWAYISNLEGFPQLSQVLNDSQLSVVIAWRIASYHVPLVFMWIALMKLAIGKITISETNNSATSVSYHDGKIEDKVTDRLDESNSKHTLKDDFSISANKNLNKTKNSEGFLNENNPDSNDKSDRTGN